MKLKQISVSVTPEIEIKLIEEASRSDKNSISFAALKLIEFAIKEKERQREKSRRHAKKSDS